MDLLPDLADIMPRNREGDMYIGACLLEVDVEGLVGDEMWKTYTTMVG